MLREKKLPLETTRLPILSRDCIMPMCPPVVAAVSQPSIKQLQAHPILDKKLRADPAMTSSSKGKHKLPDEDSAVEEGVWCMEMPFHAI